MFLILVSDWLLELIEASYPSNTPPNTPPDSIIITLLRFCLDKTMSNFQSLRKFDFEEVFVPHIRKSYHKGKYSHHIMRDCLRDAADVALCFRTRLHN